MEADPCDAFTAVPFTTAGEAKGDTLHVTATLANPALKSTFTDTYFNDLNPQAPFNDSALINFDLPADWVAIDKVEAPTVKVGQRSLTCRLVGYAVETDHGKRRLHAQVDVAATAFHQSPLRTAGATVELVIQRKR